MNSFSFCVGWDFSLALGTKPVWVWGELSALWVLYYKTYRYRAEFAWAKYEGRF